LETLSGFYGDITQSLVGVTLIVIFFIFITHQAFIGLSS